MKLTFNLLSLWYFHIDLSVCIGFFFALKKRKFIVVVMFIKAGVEKNAVEEISASYVPSKNSNRLL